MLLLFLFGILHGTLGADLLGNISPGKGVIHENFWYCLITQIISEYKDVAQMNQDLKVFIQKSMYLFFYLGFLSWTFTIHRTAVEGGGYFFNSSLPFSPASHTLRY